MRPQDSSLIRNSLLSMDAVALGSLVLNVKSPEQDFYRLDTMPQPEDDILTQSLAMYNDSIHCAGSSRFYALLKNLVSVAYDDQQGRIINMKTAVRKRYQLKNSGDWFAKICKSQSAQEWLIKALKRGRNIFLVSGYDTVVDAQLSARGSISTGTFAMVQVSQSGSATPGGDIPEVGAGLFRSDSLDRRTNFFAPGEQIYAVQYRKLKFHWYQSKNCDSAFLEHGNRWKVYWSVRGQEIEEEIVDAEIGDNLEKKDLRKPSCETISMEDEEFFYIP